MHLHGEGGPERRRGRIFEDRALVGLAISADGQSLYVVGKDSFAARVDARSGAVVGRFAGNGFGRILVVMSEPG